MSDQTASNPPGSRFPAEFASTSVGVGGATPLTGHSSSRWTTVTRSPEFKDLMADKRRFTIPAVLFFVAYYFALPILVGYAPSFMKTRVWGYLNLAYLFALSQFVMTWLMAWLYMRSAAKLDVKRERIARQLGAPRENARG